MNKKGTRNTNGEGCIYNTVAKQGCHIHMCRHTATTRMIEAGMDLLVIANILGHVDDRQIKETYGHILNNF